MCNWFEAPRHLARTRVSPHDWMLVQQQYHLRRASRTVHSSSLASFRSRLPARLPAIQCHAFFWEGLVRGHERRAAAAGSKVVMRGLRPGSEGVLHTSGSRHVPFFYTVFLRYSQRGSRLPDPAGSCGVAKIIFPQKKNSKIQKHTTRNRHTLDSERNLPSLALPFSLQSRSRPVFSLACKFEAFASHAWGCNIASDLDQCVARQRCQARSNQARQQRRREILAG